MSKSIIGNNNDDQNKSNSNNKKRHNAPFSSRIAVPILFAALIGTTGGSIALASMVGQVFQLFPSAEAKQVVMCSNLVVTIVGKEKKNDVFQVQKEWMSSLD